MKFLLVLLVVTATFFAACSKKQPAVKDEYITLTYRQSFCADPWVTASTDSATLVNVAAYLNAANLYIASINIKQETAPDLCMACTCKTGKVIYITTFNSTELKEQYQRIGFRIK